MNQPKQVIVMRRDLKMRRGKEIAQACHASMAFLTRRLASPSRLNPGLRHCFLYDVEIQWLQESFKKVCVRVDSEEELDEIAEKAKVLGVACHIITDSGKTEFDGVPTKTCLALGPDEAEKIDELTGHLEVY